MIFAVVVPAAAKPSVEPAGAPSFIAAPADCASTGQTGGNADPSPTPAGQSGIGAMPVQARQLRRHRAWRS